MKKMKIRSINKKIITLVSILIIASLLTVSIANYFIAKREITRSNDILLENVIESFMFEINRNYSYTLGDKPWMTEEDAKEASLMSLRALKSKQDQDALSSASLNEVDGTSSATVGSEHKYHTFNLGESGYFFIVNSNGDIVSHPFLSNNILNIKSRDGRSIIQDMISLAKEGGGTSSYELAMENSKDPGSKMVYTKYFPHWDWVVSAVIYDNELLRGSDIILTTNIIWLIVLLALSLVYIITLTRKITKPIIDTSKMLAQIAKGDLTVNKLYIKANDETRVLADSANYLIDELNRIISQISNSSNHLSAFSSSLQISSSQVSSASDDISNSINDMAASTEMQTRYTSEAVGQVESLGIDIKKTADASTSIESSIQHSIRFNEDGLTTVEELRNASFKNAQHSNDIELVINNLNNKVEAIGEIVGLISGIAKQTNLLALNANIEAARAGIHGLGFAVVAEEVSKLASEAALATKNISDNITEIQDLTHIAVGSIKNNSLNTENMNASVKKTEKIYKNISNELQTLIDGINIIIERNKKNNEEKDNILEMLHILSESSLEHTSLIQEISAAAEEQTSSVDEVVDNIEQINNMIGDLNEIVNRFNV